jgi:isocitrate dehydrogenase
MFEATHGTAPKYADKRCHQSGSVDFVRRDDVRFLGWNEAADLIESGTGTDHRTKTVTYDFERLMQGATKV